MKEYLTPLSVIIAAIMIGAVLISQKDIGRYQTSTVEAKNWPNGFVVIVTDTKTGKTHIQIPRQE